MSGFCTAVAAVIMAIFFTHLLGEKTLDSADVKEAEDICRGNSELDKLSVGEIRITIHCTNGAMFNVQKATYQ